MPLWHEGQAMPQRKFLLSTEQISKDISYFTIGFATLNVNGNVEDAVSAGSGTLVIPPRRRA
jgi:hypothetical protein